MDALNRAIVLYIGRGMSPYPKEDESRVVDHFGASQGSTLAAQVRKILEELQRMQPNWDQHDLVGASKWAVSQLKLKHEGLDDAAVAALEWIYSWWWK